jgi:prepilin-type N-terminal cleavage/methylation domain-containing protein
MRNQFDNSSPRRGYTLLELLLVLAILVIVASAVTPVVVARMSEYRLKQAAEMTRIALSATRIHAIDASSSCQFRFEPGGRRYLSVPTDGDAVSAPNGSQQPSGGTGKRTGVESGQLPEDLSFQIVATPVPGNPAAPAAVMPATPANDSAWSSAIAKIPNAPDYTSAVWSPPIVFRSDGTAVESALDIVDKHGDGYHITVRELTGEVTVTRLTTGTL